MESANHEFTDLTTLRPEAQGEPGKRTFRILVNSGSSSATVWLEKEQLFQLALAIQQLLSTVPEDTETAPGPPLDREAPGLTNLDFKVGKLVLGHEGSIGMFIIDAHDEADEEGDTATLRIWANRDQAKGFSEEAFKVCAAGRPLCPLCGGPIDPTGHVCPRVNGHPQIREL